MLNPLWPGLELVMADTLAEVPIPPDHEARLTTIMFVLILMRKIDQQILHMYTGADTEPGYGARPPAKFKFLFTSYYSFRS